MKKNEGLSEKIWRKIGRLRHFALMRIDPRVDHNNAGHFVRESYRELGLAILPELLWLLRTEDELLPGQHIVGCYVPARPDALPDWGGLTVRQSGGWVLRSRDGQTVWVSGRRGLPICLRGEGRAI
ncbi:MAG: hypothetical protein ACYDCI_00340 [Candidatus Limnocylindrales bacterium]